MNSKFEQMSTAKLTAYVLNHRDDLEALDALVSRRTHDEEATWYPAVSNSDGTPIEENIRIMEEAIQNKIKRSRQ